MNKIWSDEAWEDYLYWQTQDKKTLKRINALVKDIDRNGPMEGIGEPEALKGNLQGFFSRRINEKDRLVYRIENNCARINKFLVPLQGTWRLPTRIPRNRLYSI